VIASSRSLSRQSGQARPQRQSERGDSGMALPSTKTKGEWSKTSSDQDHLGHHTSTTFVEDLSDAQSTSKSVALLYGHRSRVASALILPCSRLPSMMHPASSVSSASTNSPAHLSPRDWTYEEQHHAAPLPRMDLRAGAVTCPRLCQGRLRSALLRHELPLVFHYFSNRIPEASHAPPLPRVRRAASLPRSRFGGTD